LICRHTNNISRQDNYYKCMSFVQIHHQLWPWTNKKKNNNPYHWKHVSVASSSVAAACGTTSKTTWQQHAQWRFNNHGIWHPFPYGTVLHNIIAWWSLKCLNKVLLCHGQPCWTRRNCKPCHKHCGNVFQVDDINMNHTNTDTLDNSNGFVQWCMHLWELFVSSSSSSSTNDSITVPMSWCVIPVQCMCIILFWFRYSLISAYYHILAHFWEAIYTESRFLPLQNVHSDVILFVISHFHYHRCGKIPIEW